MLSLPPPHEWDVLWLRRLASLDCEQYRYYTTTLCRDVWLLHQQAIGEKGHRRRRGHLLPPDCSW